MRAAAGQIAAASIAAAVGDASVCEMDVINTPLRSDVCGRVPYVLRAALRFRLLRGLCTNCTLRTYESSGPTNSLLLLWQRAPLRRIILARHQPFVRTLAIADQWR